MPIVTYYSVHYSKEVRFAQPFFPVFPACQELSKYFCVQFGQNVLYYAHKRQAGGPEHIGNGCISNTLFFIFSRRNLRISGRYGAFGSADGCFVVLLFYKLRSIKMIDPADYRCLIPLSFGVIFERSKLIG